MDKITIGIVAHVDAGKTSLSEYILHETGIIRNMGRVDKKNAFLDHYSLERERGITIFSKQAVFQLGEKEFTLLDTPGHVDFSAEMERTLKVLDYAILLISSMDGVTGHTKTLWKLLRLYDIPTFIFVNKMDAQGADQSSLSISLKKNLSDSCIDYLSEDFFEEAATCDEEALSEYLKNGTLSAETVQALICERKLFPVFYGSAINERMRKGNEALLRCLSEYCVPKDYSEEFSARVFKISRDENKNRLTHLKVTGGTLLAKSVLAEEKINQIRIYNGEKYVTVTEAGPGTVCAVTGLEKTMPGMCLGFEEGEDRPILEPVLSYSVILPKDCPAAVFLPKLRELYEEQPELSVVWDEEMGEIKLRVMGEVQLEIVKSLVKDRYGVDIDFGIGKIVYKETIRNTVEGIGHFEPLRHYAEVHLLMEPTERGTGLTFDTNVSEDILDKNWQRLILTHLQERFHKGVLTGSRITDMKISVINGRAHNKHTEGGDFRQATYRAVRQGLMKAESVLLEPYFSFLIELPKENTGRAFSDLEGMHARFSIASQDEESTTIKGMAAVRLIKGYQLSLTSYTKGRGQMSVAFCGYYECMDWESIVAEIGYDPIADVRNTPDSVFCAGGSGFIVPWNEVENHMHCEGYMMTKKEAKERLSANRSGAKEELWLGTEEIDAILDKTFFANSRNKGEHSRWKLSRQKQPLQAQTPDFGVRRSDEKTRPKTAKEKYLLVDGYNILFSWEELSELSKTSVDAARGKLLDILSNYQGIRKMNLIVVFDAYKVQGHNTEIFDYHNIHVVFTKEAQTADAFIEKFSTENASKYDITVATSDGLEQIIIRGQGCALLSARDFEKEVGETAKNSLQTYQAKNPKEKTFVMDLVPELQNMKFPDEE